MSDTRLGDVVEIITGNPFKSSGYTDDLRAIRLLRGDNVSQGRIRWENAKLWPSDEANFYNAYALRAGDVILAMDRPWIEAGLKYAELRPDDVPSLLVQRVACLRARAGLSQRFLAALIGSPQFTNYILGVQTGTAVPHISAKQISDFMFTLPDLATQNAVGQLLGALDDKIAINDRIVEVSSDLALTYGSQVLGIESGPKVTMSDCAYITKGVSYRGTDLVGDEAVLISLKCVARDGKFQPSGVKPFNGECKPDQVVGDGDIIVAQTDLTQRAEVIGRPSRVINLGGWGRMVASLDLAIVRAKEGITNEVLFAILASRQFHEHALSHCNGTTVLHMGARALPTFRFSRPSAQIISRVTATMRPLFARSDQARRESQSLAKLRDVLLPKLMSGEIRVHDAERIVEDAT